MTNRVESTSVGDGIDFLVKSLLSGSGYQNGKCSDRGDISRRHFTNDTGLRYSNARGALESIDQL